MTFCIRWNRSSLFQPECWQQIVIVTWLSIIWQASVHNAFELIYAPTTWETPATHQPRQQRRRITNQLILFRVKVLTHINPEGIIPNTRQVDPLLVSHQVILTTVHLLACSLARSVRRERKHLTTLQFNTLVWCHCLGLGSNSPLYQQLPKKNINDLNHPENNFNQKVWRHAISLLGCCGSVTSCFPSSSTHLLPLPHPPPVCSIVMFGS